jgi:hypothetical protein
MRTAERNAAQMEYSESLREEIEAVQAMNRDLEALERHQQMEAVARQVYEHLANQAKYNQAEQVKEMLAQQGSKVQTIVEDSLGSAMRSFQEQLQSQQVGSVQVAQDMRKLAAEHKVDISGAVEILVQNIEEKYRMTAHQQSMMVQLLDAAQAKAQQGREYEAATFLKQLSLAVSSLNDSVQGSLALQASQRAQQVEMQELTLRLAETQKAAEEAAVRLREQAARRPQQFAMSRGASSDPDAELDRLLEENAKEQTRRSRGRLPAPAKSREQSFYSDPDQELDRLLAENQQQQERRGRGRLPKFNAAEELRINQQAAQIAQALDGAKAAGGGGSFAAALSSASSSGLSAPPLFAAPTGGVSTSTLLAPLQTGGLLAPIGQTATQPPRDPTAVRLQFSNPYMQQRSDMER